MTLALENLNPRKDAFLIQNFAKMNPEDREGEKEHNHSQPLETTEADINSILNHPSGERSELFYDDSYIQQINSELGVTKPWMKDPNYFQHVHISSLALLKMTIHARSGGSIEIMGMLTGRIVKNGIVVMDVYPLPVEGTETRVNAQAEGYEFMVQYLDSLKKSGRYENIVGWYHSHPGYGCWLSGIDVATQSLNQQFQDPYLAIVVDPERTMANGKVEIGAFRTYTDEFVKSSKLGTASNPVSLGTSPFAMKRNSGKKSRPGKAQDIPSEKIQDFGLHSSKYYSLSVEIFRSHMDHLILKNLWNKFWISNLLGASEDTKNSDADELEAFINGKLDAYQKRLQFLKTSESKAVKLMKTKTTDFIKGVAQSVRGNEIDMIQAQRQSLLSTRKARLKHFQKSNEPNDSEDSDSEMNDDSDADSRNLQEDLEDEVPRYNTGSDVDTGFKFLRDSRKNFTGLSVASPTQPNLFKLSHHPGASESHTKLENDDDKKIRTSAAEASRKMVTLKLQEILFLIE